MMMLQNAQTAQTNHDQHESSSQVFRLASDFSGLTWETGVESSSVVAVCYKGWIENT